MTTKPPPSIKSIPEESLEAIAYAAVAEIPTVEPHDRDRLGYNVWRCLALKLDPLEVAVKSAGARLQISEKEALERIRRKLSESGIAL
jgi:hypothetical protein